MALDVPAARNTCRLTTPGVRCPVEEATWAESTENSVHCACWHESNYGDVPCCWCGQAGRFEGFVQSCCVDCDTPITHHQDAPRPLLCQSCEETAAQAQRDHQVREAAHELLAALEWCCRGHGEDCSSLMGHDCDCGLVGFVSAAIAKARGGAT